VCEFAAEIDYAEKYSAFGELWFCCSASVFTDDKEWEGNVHGERCERCEGYSGSE